MPDPFEALRTAPTPIDPDPAFANLLRARVFGALHPHEGDTSMIVQTPETTDRLHQGDVSYTSLWVPDVERAARFYGTVLGWTYAAEIADGSRQVQARSISQGIAELGGAADFFRQLGMPIERVPGPTAYVVFVVGDLRASVERVRAAGGWASDPEERPYGRMATCRDDQGLLFSLHEVPAGVPAPRPPATGVREGDVCYLAFELADAARAQAFYGAVLGLQFSRGRARDGWNIADIVPTSGMSGGHTRPAVVPMYRVDDIRAAVERVRASGGTATEPVFEGYGTRAECVDNQGLRFYLGQL